MIRSRARSGWTLLVLLTPFAGSAACATGGKVGEGEGSNDDGSGGSGLTQAAGGAGLGGSPGLGGFGGDPGAGGSGAIGEGGIGAGGASAGGAGSGGSGGGVTPLTCGNGAIDIGETCDGANLAGQTCATVLGHPGATGTLTCSPSCTLDSSACAACGDGTLQGAEECDDGNATANDGCEACQVVCVGSEAQFGLNCYADVTSTATRAAAHAACTSSLGGHLVTIESAAENNFVWLEAMSFFSTSPRWIDLSDQATEGTFVWSTGEPLTYTNWASGEPNNSSGNEDCVEFRYGDNEWNDANCGNARPFICEYEPPVLNP
jgi:cysteine-rich repeat protein